MSLPDPYELDQKIAVAARAWSSFRRELRTSGAIDHRFESDGAVATLELLSELEAAPLAPLVAAQRRWLWRLGEQHRHLEQVRLVAAAFRRDLVRVPTPEPMQTSLRALLQRALVDGPRRSAWLSALAEHGGKLRAERLALWERRSELREKLGAERADALELPGPHVLAAAERFLERTKDAYDDHRVNDLSSLIELLLGSERIASWPARLSLRSLVELVDGARWFEELDLTGAQLPAPLSAMSFARGLGCVGAEFRRAARGRTPSWSLSHDPFALGEHTYAALFAAFPLLPSFAERRLGVARHALGDFRRVLAFSWLAESRAQAFRLLLRAPLLRGGAVFENAFQELFAGTFGCEIDPRLRAVLLTPRSDQAARFGGLLSSARLADDLRQRHDEDWFRNPRAREELRENARLPDETLLSEDELEVGSKALEQMLNSAC